MGQDRCLRARVDAHETDSALHLCQNYKVVEIHWGNIFHRDLQQPLIPLNLSYLSIILSESGVF